MTDLARPVTFEGTTFTTREAFADALAAWARTHPPTRPARLLVHLASWQTDGRPFDQAVMTDGIVAGWVKPLTYPFDADEDTWRLAHPGVVIVLTPPAA